MKSILEFNLPEDRNQFLMAIRGADFHSAIWDIGMIVRDHTKYDLSADTAIDRIKDTLDEIILYEIE